MTDDPKDLLDDDEDDLGLDSDPDKGEPEDDKKPPKSDEKRIRDLQSARDKETARANKAEARLKALEAALKVDDADGGTPAAPADGGMSGDVVLDMARMLTYQQYPKLAEYDIKAADLQGSTPAEMAEHATALIARFEKVETRMRNKLLAENGLAPEIGSSEPDPKRDFSKMPTDDFNRLVENAMRQPPTSSR